MRPVIAHGLDATPVTFDGVADGAMDVVTEPPGAMVGRLLSGTRDLATRGLVRYHGDPHFKDTPEEIELLYRDNFIGDALKGVFVQVGGGFDPARAASGARIALGAIADMPKHKWSSDNGTPRYLEIRPGDGFARVRLEDGYAQSADGHEIRIPIDVLSNIGSAKLSPELYTALERAVVEGRPAASIRTRLFETAMEAERKAR